MSVCKMKPETAKTKRKREQEAGVSWKYELLERCVRMCFNTVML